MHSATEYPEAYGVRTGRHHFASLLAWANEMSVHQCHIASSTPPLGPHDSTVSNGEVKV
jgi:hypothetical protein